MYDEEEFMLQWRGNMLAELFRPEAGARVRTTPHLRHPHLSCADSPHVLAFKATRSRTRTS